MERNSSPFIQGVLGGIIAGAVVALWLFAVDVFAGDVFGTPGRLSSILLGEEYSEPWPRHVFLFTQLHFGVFIALGIATNWCLRKYDAKPGLLLGALFGIVVLNVVHYFGLLMTGTNLMTAVPVVHVVLANLCSGMAMMVYFGRKAPAERAERSPAEATPGVAGGLLTGLIGACAVAFWFLIVDLVADAPFSTPSTLGYALLLGAEGPGDVRVGLGVVLAYSVLHLAVFLGVGLAFDRLSRRIEGTTGFLAPALLVLVGLEVLFLGTAASTSSWALETIGWRVILAGNLVAVVSMVGWTLLRRPQLRNVVLG